MLKSEFTTIINILNTNAEVGDISIGLIPLQYNNNKKSSKRSQNIFA